MSIKDEYKNHDNGGWLEREQRWPKESLAHPELFDTVDREWLEKERKWVEKNITDAGYFDDGDDRMGIVHLGRYRPFFDAVETSLERKATVYDYHLVYKWILDNITTDIFADSLLLTMDGKRLPESFKDIIVAFDGERKKLDDLFAEYAAKIEKSDMEKLTEINREILQVVKETNRKVDFVYDADNGQTLTPWQQHLVNKALVFEDGKRTQVKLDEVAYELAMFTKKPVSSQFLLENFLQRNGKKYSPKTCNLARDWANTKK